MAGSVLPTRQGRARVPDGYMRNRGFGSLSRTQASRAGGASRKIPSFETSGVPRRIAVAAIQRSAVCAFWQRVANGLAVGAKLGVDGNEPGAAMNNLNPLKLRFAPEHPSVAPPSTDPAIPQLSSRLERDERGPAGG